MVKLQPTFDAKNLCADCPGLSLVISVQDWQKICFLDFKIDKGHQCLYRIKARQQCLLRTQQVQGGPKK